jgi:hypothetical protein
MGNKKEIMLDWKYVKGSAEWDGTAMLVVPSKYDSIGLCIQPKSNSGLLEIAEIRFHDGTHGSFKKVEESALAFARELARLWNQKYCPERVGDE